MYNTILVAIALQNWDRYSAHALAAREVGVALANGTSKHLHVLSAYDYEDIKEMPDLPIDMAARHREDLIFRTNELMRQKLDEYVAPLKAEGLKVTTILQVGNPRKEIVQVATNIKADLLIIGSHSKRGLLDIALGGTAQQVSRRAPCPVVIVSPKT
jgi:nucleotide-binding universal stress UspA family protein